VFGIEANAFNRDPDPGQGTFQVYEYPLFKQILKRQRLGLRFSGGSLEESVLVIDFDNVGDRDSVEQTYERVRQELLRRYGPATRTYEQGRFTANFVADVNSQRLIRKVEWVTDAGILRFGIPRRLDGLVHMEIRHARRLPRPGETLWSVEEIR